MARETVAGLRVQLDAMTARATRAEKQVDELTKALVKVSTPIAPPKRNPRQGTPDVEGQAVERAERTVKNKAGEAFLARATKDLEGKGYSQREAAREAKKLLAEAMDMQSPSG